MYSRCRSSTVNVTISVHRALMIGLGTIYPRGPDGSPVVGPAIQLSDNLIEKPAGLTTPLPPLLPLSFSVPLRVRKMIYERDTVNLFSDAKLHLVKSA